MEVPPCPPSVPAPLATFTTSVPALPDELRRFQFLTRTVPSILLLLLLGAGLVVWLHTWLALILGLILLIAVLVGFASTARGLSRWANTHLYLVLPSGVSPKTASDGLYPLTATDAAEIDDLRLNDPDTTVILPPRLSLNPLARATPTHVRAGDLAPLRRNQSGLLGLMG